MGFDYFSDCKNLRELNLHGTNINSKAIFNLKPIASKTLEKLNISYTIVGKDGLVCLQCK